MLPMAVPRSSDGVEIRHCISGFMDDVMHIFAHKEQERRHKGFKAVDQPSYDFDKGVVALKFWAQK